MLVASSLLLVEKSFTLWLCRYETEKNLRLIVEADLPRLRGVMREIKMSIADLETQLTGAQEDLLYLKKTHEEVNPPFHYSFHFHGNIFITQPVHTMLSLFFYTGSAHVESKAKWLC